MGKRSDRFRGVANMLSGAQLDELARLQRRYRRLMIAFVVLAVLWLADTAWILLR